MNSKWLMVVIGWGIVWPIVAIGAAYLASWGAGRASLRRSGCGLSGSPHRPYLYHPVPVLSVRVGRA